MPNSKQAAACRTCGKELARDARMCPYCGQYRPVTASSLVRTIAWVVGLSAAAVTTIAFVSALDKHLSSAFLIGRTYAVAKLGPICATIQGLANADSSGVSTLAEADRYGCVVVAPHDRISLTMLEKNATLVKVRVNAPGQDADKFEGWTKAENVVPPSHPYS
jgi:hypothetical protein